MSTLHTNSAPETLTRLENMGIPRFNIATTVSLVIAQRLGRRLCSHCKKIIEIPRETLLEEGFKEEEIDSLKIFGPVGCEQCKEGYKGRVGFYEVLEVSEAISRCIMAGGNSMDILDIGRKEGMVTIREAGLIRVRQGVTTIEEVNSVTKE